MSERKNGVRVGALCFEFGVYIRAESFQLRPKGAMFFCA